jgi:serine/threonine-protein kinase
MSESPAENQSSAREPASSAQLPEDLQDQALGEFRLLRRLGKGGMAEVYLAEQKSLKRQVAIKILRADMLDEKDQVLIKRFEHEAMAAGGLSHPNIVQVYVVGETNGIHYIAQEYVQGPNLKDYVKKKGPPDLPFALKVMRQTASALQAAGEAGIVHRDIKPENIMLTRKGEVRVADFGLAQLSSGPEGVNLTQVGMTMGTPLYMSPEQIHGKKVDHRSDLYSFGVTCYYLLTGKAPFDGDSPLSIAVKHLNEEPVPLSEIRPDLPRRLTDLIHQMMTKKPQDRPANAGEVVTELKQISRLLKEEPDSPELNLSDFSMSGVGTAKARLLPPDLGKRIGILVAAVVPVLLISAGIGWVMRTPDPFASKAPPDQLPPIKQEDTAEEQLIRAAQIGGLEQWQAVADYWEENQEVYFKARIEILKELIRLQRIPEAKEIVNDFATQKDYFSQAVAKAGNAILLHIDGKYRESQNTIDTINRSYLPDAMASFLQQFEEKNQLEIDELNQSSGTSLFKPVKFISESSETPHSSHNPPLSPTVVALTAPMA